jgi:hypothetical protein
MFEIKENDEYVTPTPDVEFQTFEDLKGCTYNDIVE